MASKPKSKPFFWQNGNLSVLLQQKHEDDMVKALFFDIDGTLVSFRTHKIPTSTLEAIHKARRKGIKVFVATGRPLPFIDNLGKMEYDGILSFTGAHCELKDGTILRHIPIAKTDVCAMLRYATEHRTSVSFACVDRAITSPITPEARQVYKMLNITNVIEKEFCDLGIVEEMDVLQMIPFFDEKEQNVVEKLMPNCDTARWHPAFVDLIRKGNSKPAGMDAVLDYFGIALEDCMAFGDGGNDIGMLQHAGWGVAMGNASEDVKAIADEITASVDEDGIAYILQRYT